MTSRKILFVVCAAAFAAGFARAQFSHVYLAGGNVPIPASGTGGAPGGASNPANAASITVNVTNAVVVTNVTLEVGITHTSVGDLRIEIAHCGTSAVLYNQSPASSADLSGVYDFDDGAPTSFTAAVTAAGNGTVPSGDYRPATPLTGFYGASSGGPWTITAYDLTGGNVGTLSSLRITITGVSSYGSSSTVVAIPDGSGGQCLDPAVKLVNVGTHALVEDMVVHLTFQHTFISDLDVTLHHGNVSVGLSLYGQPSSGANVQGTYEFWDGAATAWTAAELSYATIPTGTYRPAQALSAFAGLDQHGLWYLTVCDRAGFDVGTLGLVTLEISRSPYDLVVFQPSGPASFVLGNLGGVPGNTFVNLFTLAQGAAPSGWVYGLDIALVDIITQINFGPPYTGTIGACGTTVFTVGGPIPSGLTVWGVSIELDSTMTPVASRPVFTYTTL
jgi:subtilisin-like proprotein convertase family protein